MFRLIPAPVHRGALRLAHTLRSMWWHWRPPVGDGVRVVAINSRLEVLLVKHSYGNHDWYLPGGGLRRGEEACDGAVREMQEESGCLLANCAIVEHFVHTRRGLPTAFYIVAGHASGRPRADHRETIAARFFALRELPANLDPWLHQMLPAWVADIAPLPADGWHAINLQHETVETEMLPKRDELAQRDK